MYKGLKLEDAFSILISISPNVFIFVFGLKTFSGIPKTLVERQPFYCAAPLIAL